jgi:hypothetical protein
MAAENVWNVIVHGQEGEMSKLVRTKPQLVMKMASPMPLLLISKAIKKCLSVLKTKKTLMIS